MLVGLLSADGVLTCHGDRVDVVMHDGFHAEAFGKHFSVFTDDGLGLRFHTGHGKGRADAHTLAERLGANLVLDGQTVAAGGAGGSGVDLIGRLGIQLQNAGQLLIARFQSGKDGLGIGLQECQGKAACHAHVGRTAAGDSGGADPVSDTVQFTGIAVLGGKLGNGSLQQQLHADCGNQLLFFQLLTDGSNGLLIGKQGIQQEGWVQEQLRKILKQGLRQNHSPVGDGTQRIALDIGEHDLEDHILQQFLVREAFRIAVLGSVLIQQLCLLFLTEVVQQRILCPVLLQKGLDQDGSAGFHIRKEFQQLRENLVHAAAVCRFQDVGADNEVVRRDGPGAHIGLVLILHIVDSRGNAHAIGAVAGGGVRVDNRVGVLEGGDPHIPRGRNGHAVGDAGKGLVGMDIRRDGSRHLDTALGGHHAGYLT